MLVEPRSADFAIWLIALALYVFDAAKLLSPRELLLVEAGRGRLASVFSAHPFTLTGRVLAFAPLVLPHRGAFVAGWGRAWTDDRTLAATLAALAELRATLRPARVLAVWGFALLFVIGPGLTFLLGPDSAVLYVGAVLYPTVFVAIGVLWWRRRALGLTRGHAAMVSVEILVCPAFLPNLVRKITTAHAVEGDGAQIVLAAAGAGVKAEFLARLASRTEELINEAGDDEGGQAQLRAYLTTVQAAR